MVRRAEEKARELVERARREAEGIKKAAVEEAGEGAQGGGGARGKEGLLGVRDKGTARAREEGEGGSRGAEAYGWWWFSSRAS